MTPSTSCAMLRNATKRTFATKAAVESAKGTVLGYQQSKLANGVLVGGVETNTPVVRLALMSKAGSRYETAENRGAAHVLRIMTGSRTNDTTAVTMTRHLQQLGASLSCSVTRDNVSYNLTCLRDHVSEALQYLREAALQPLFRQWELKDNTFRLAHDLALLKKNPQAMLSECLHEAAYRSGLSNSLHCPEYMVGHHTTEMMTNYVKQHFTAGRLSVLSVGMHHDEAAEIAKTLSVDSGAGVSASSAYRGGEVRRDTGGAMAHAAVAVEMPGSLTMKEIAALDILAGILGEGARTKYGSSLGSRFGAALAKAAPDHPCSASSFFMLHEGSGLYGFTASAPSEVAAKVLKAVADEMKIVIGGKLTDADVAAGKSKLMMRAVGGTLQDSFDEMTLYGQALREDLGNVEQNMQAFNSVTAQDVSAVARKVLGGKPCMAAIGNTANVPYIDQL